MKKDLESYLPKVKPGGFITGDDYGNPGWWQDGVTRAVNEFIGQHPCKAVLIENHQFLLQLSNARAEVLASAEAASGAA